MTHKNLADVLAHHAETIGDKPVFHYIAPRQTKAVTLTYRQLHRVSCQLASHFQQQNLQGKSALLLYPPGIHFIEAFFGCLRGNVSAVPMYIPAGDVPDTRLTAIAKTVDIAAVFTVKAKKAQAESLMAQLYPDRKCKVICTDDIDCQMPLDVVPVDMALPPLIQFTSGSTSDPKGVMVTHQNLLVNQQMMRRGFSQHTHIKGGETLVSWLPFFHDMGLVCGILYPVYSGGTGVLISPNDFLLRPIKWLQLISMYGATISGAPNFAYDYCVSRINPAQLDGLDLSSWKVAFNGSEMIRPWSLNRFVERFGPCGFSAEAMFNCYGMAETTLYVAGTTGQLGDSDHLDQIASVGVPDEAAEVLIVDEHCHQAPEGTVAEIWIRGPHVAAGYINNQAATEQTFQATLAGADDGKTYLRTGDLGFLQQGELYIAGRLKNLIVVNGKNYFGEEIEYFVARAYPFFVESGACILQRNEGLTDSEIIFMQEINQASIDVAKEDLQQLADNAQRLSREVLDHFKLSVHRFIFLGNSRLPRTSSGKIDRAKAHQFAIESNPHCILAVDTR